MYRLCTLADIADNDARGFRSPLGEVIVARQGLMVYGYLNRCPHIGIGLNFQPDVFMDLTQRYLLCANHGALFENPSDGVELIKLKEIMHELEKATDALEGVGKAIKIIVVKYA